MQIYDRGRKNIIVSFISVSVLLIVFGLISISKMIDLSDLTQKLYEHPLKVTNATKNIQIHLISIHRHMKDVILSKDEKDIIIAIENVRRNEKKVYEEFDIVFENYLGDKADIQKSYDLFVKWEDIRAKTINYKVLGKTDEALNINQELALKHLNELSENVDTLIAYAQNKAEVFVSDAHESKRLAIRITIVVIISILLLIFSIMSILLRRLKKAEIIKYKQEQQIIAQSRLAQMGEMISMIAHQWRQPLGAISATSLDLKMKIELEMYDFSTLEGLDEAKEYFRNGLNDIENFTNSLSMTIDDFRNFYKPNKKVKRLTINEPVQKGLNIVRSSLLTSNIGLIEEYNSSKVLKLFDGELMQVVLNMFENSRNNFKENDIQNAKIWIMTQDTQRGVLLSICDNGGGIDESIIDKIFDPYFSTKDDKNGTGLGLYMSKIIIEDHHDGILSVSNKNGGACFGIEIKDEKC